MNWFTQLLSTGASKVIDSVGSIIDNVHTSDEEKLKLKNEFSNAINGFTLDMEKESNKFEENITSRWKSDNEHGITKLVRPLSYCFVLVLFAIIVMSDGNIGEFKVNASYIPVIETLLATMTVAYFGSRGIEKTAKHFKGKNNDR